MKRYLFFISLIILAFQPVAVNAGSIDWATLMPDLSDATYVKDDQKCLECHEEYMEPYSKTIHAKTFKFAARNDSEGLGCENCHGPLSKHLDAPKKSPPLVVSFKKERGLTSQQKSSICLQCHEGGKRALWLGGIHDSRGLSCNICHYVMEKRSDQSLFIGENAQDACFKCHKQLRAQINKQSHHPIKEGKIRCQDCHNPHGTVADKLISANSINEKCYECHAEKRGPFLWEHPPATESCLSCHTPHGSSHDKLLVAKRPYLCQRCHSNQQHPGTPYGLSDTQVAAGNTVYQASNTRLFYRSCQNCHSQIHGSNHPSGKFYQR